MRALALVEIAILVFSVAVQVWIFGKMNIWFTLTTFAFIALGIAVRRESLWKLGLTHVKCRQFKLINSICTLVFAGILVLGVLYNPSFGHLDYFRVVKALAAYCAWGLVQQFLQNSVLTRRLAMVLPNPVLAALVSGTIFALLHLPNPFLFFVTLVLGVASAYFFLQGTSICVLGAWHAVLGTTMMFILPATWHHGMTVGLSYARYCLIHGSP